jgi:hypothetical protein
LVVEKQGKLKNLIINTALGPRFIEAKVGVDKL